MKILIKHFKFHIEVKSIKLLLQPEKLKETDLSNIEPIVC